MIIDLGCGRACYPGAVGVDRHRGNARVIADVLHLPFRSGTVAGVRLSNVLEHFRRPDLVLAEAHRVLAPGGQCHIRLPHYTSPAAWSPDHRWAASLQVLRLWASADPPGGWRSRLYGWQDYVDASLGPRRWRLVSRRLEFHRLWRWLGVEWLANIYPELWEAFAAYRPGARDIVAVLESLPEEVKS